MADNNDTSIRVLLVDDEVSYTRILSKRMAVRGMQATAVDDGPAAIQALRGDTFDVALLDLKMEEMDGLEVLKIFRVMAPEMQVIILSGHGGEAEARLSLKNGAFDYLVKPCDLETITCKIKEAIAAGNCTSET